MASHSLLSSIQLFFKNLIIVLIFYVYYIFLVVSIYISLFLSVCVCNTWFPPCGSVKAGAVYFRAPYTSAVTQKTSTGSRDTTRSSTNSVPLSEAHRHTHTHTHRQRHTQTDTDTHTDTHTHTDGNLH